MWRKLNNHVQKDEIVRLSYNMHKNQPQWIKDLNIKPETIKLEGKIGSKLIDIGLGDVFLVLTWKAKISKEKINK